GLYVDNNVAKAEFRCDIHVGGTDISPRLAGRVDLLDGEVVFRDRRFTVTEGLITFKDQPEINPELSFTASTQVRTSETEYTIEARVSGTARDYRVLL